MKIAILIVCIFILIIAVTDLVLLLVNSRRVDNDMGYRSFEKTENNENKEK